MTWWQILLVVYGIIVLTIFVINYYYAMYKTKKFRGVGWGLAMWLLITLFILSLFFPVFYIIDLIEEVKGSESV